MNFRNLSWVTLAVLGCGGAALSYVRLADELSSEVSKLKRELSQVKRDRVAGAPVIREVHVASPTPVTAGSQQEPLPVAARAVPEPPELALAALEAEEAEKKRYAEARQSFFQTEHANEPEDPAWSRLAEAEIAEYYAAPEYKALRITTACKYTLCRVDVAYPEGDAGREAMDKFMSDRPWQGHRTGKVNWELREASTFIAREGFELPAFDRRTLEN